MLWPFLALGIWSMASSLIQIDFKDRWSSHDFTFLYNWLPLLFVPALPWAAIKRREWMLRLLMAGVLIAGGIVVLQGLVYFDFYHDTHFSWHDLKPGAFFTGRRPPSTWDNALKFAAMLTLASLTLMSWGKTKSKITAPIVWCICILVNQTRLALGGFFLFVPLLFFRRWTLKRFLPAIGIGLLALLIFATIAYQNQGFRNRLAPVLNLQDPRIKVWEISWDNFKREPIVGYGGIRAARKAFRIYGDPTEKLTHGGTHAHNNLLAIACSYGVIGLLLWLTAHLSLLVYCWRHECRTALIVLLSYHAMGMLEDTAEERYLTCLCMFIVAVDIAWRMHPLKEQHSTQENELAILEAGNLNDRPD